MNPKILVIGGLITVAVLAGGVVIMSRQPNAAEVEKVEASKLVTDHKNYDWGQIDYDGGVAKHVFEIKNGEEAELKLANIKTSCMCTTAQVMTRTGSSPIFKMHQTSDWKGVLAAGETAKLEVIFDPAFHGPTGVGPIERIISLETSDPNQPYIEFDLKGVVIKS